MFFSTSIISAILCVVAWIIVIPSNYECIRDKRFSESKWPYRIYVWIIFLVWFGIWIASFPDDYEMQVQKKISGIDSNVAEKVVEIDETEESDVIDEDNTIEQVELKPTVVAEEEVEEIVVINDEPEVVDQYQMRKDFVTKYVIWSSELVGMSLAIFWQVEILIQQDKTSEAIQKIGEAVNTLNMASQVLNDWETDDEELLSIVQKMKDIISSYRSWYTKLSWSLDPVDVDRMLGSVLLVQQWNLKIEELSVLIEPYRDDI